MNLNSKWRHIQVKSTKGVGAGILSQVERISSDRGSWVNESDMKHVQEIIEKLHNRSAKKQKKHRV